MKINDINFGAGGVYNTRKGMKRVRNGKARHGRAR